MDTQECTSCGEKIPALPRPSHLVKMPDGTYVRACDVERIDFGSWLRRAHLDGIHNPCRRSVQAMKPRPCPKCGKPMAEEPQFKGLWMCPDYKLAINSRPPFRYKCTGSKLTKAGAKALQEALQQKWLERVIENN